MSDGLPHSWMKSTTIIDKTNNEPLQICRVCRLKASDPRSAGLCEGIAKYPEYPDAFDVHTKNLALECGVTDFETAKDIIDLGRAIRLEEQSMGCSPVAKMISRCLEIEKTKWRMKEG